MISSIVASAAASTNRMADRLGFMHSLHKLEYDVKVLVHCAYDAPGPPKGGSVA